MIEKANNINHELKIIDRNLFTLSGVNKIISFDSSEFILESNMGPIHITGSDLELLNLDTHDGIIRIKGLVNGFNYIDKPAKKKDEGFLAKLFK